MVKKAIIVTPTSCNILRDDIIEISKIMRSCSMAKELSWSDCGDLPFRWLYCRSVPLIYALALPLRSKRRKKSKRKRFNRMGTIGFEESIFAEDEEAERRKR